MCNHCRDIFHKHCGAEIKLLHQIIPSPGYHRISPKKCCSAIYFDSISNRLEIYHIPVPTLWQRIKHSLN